MEFQGKVIAVLPIKSGTTDKGEWKAQQCVIETEEEFPKRLLAEVFGEDKITQFDLKEGERVKVRFNPSAKLKDDKWFGSNRIWSVERVGAQ